MGDALRGLSFMVVEVRDGSRTQMTQAIADAKAGLQGKQAMACNPISKITWCP